MNTPLPYYREVLKKELESRIAKNARYSLRAFAAALAVEPSALSKILSGKRMLTKAMAERFFKVIDFTPDEERKFMLSAALSKQTLGVTPDESPLFQLLRQPTVESVQDLSVDIFTAISEWYYFAILEIVHLKDFESDARWIAGRLGISVQAVQIAVDRLFKLELLVKKKSGKWAKSSSFLTLADKKLSTSAHRKRQKQILAKSIEALENIPIERRNHSGITVPCDPEKLEDAKRMIRDFTRKLGVFLSTGQTSAVYELNINLFPLTQER